MTEEQENINLIIHDFNNTMFNIIGTIQNIHLTLEDEEYTNELVLDNLDIVLNNSLDAVDIILQLVKR